jgi:hypothetical protein
MKACMAILLFGWRQKVASWTLPSPHRVIRQLKSDGRYFGHVEKCRLLDPSSFQECAEEVLSFLGTLR